MTESKWLMNRAGLLNFWYYDDEIFQFRNGKLLLRGSNGSGKSVTMQSFLPVLLDGKKTPDRLDPFGSKARRMEDYLLGEKEVVDRDERTGYLFIEYRKPGTDQYLTTGMGMQAKRNKGIKSWYFLLTDNRRIGQDFDLSQQHSGEKIPLSAKELENRVALGGHVVHTQREYMELVNKYVFGFQSIDAYEDLIKLLIQLRSPKLSKDFKPTVIYEILESALPPLTDDELRHLSDTIESMDQTTQQLEQLEREYESIQRLKTIYDTYNKFILAERADQWRKSDQRTKTAEKNVQDLIRRRDEVELEINRLSEDQTKFEEQQAVLEEERRSLQQHEVWSLEESRQKKRDEFQFLDYQIKALEEKWTKQNQKLHEAWKEKEAIEVQLSELEQASEDLLEDLSNESEQAAFHNHEVNVQDYERTDLNIFDFTVWLKEANEHQKLLGALEKLAEEVNRFNEDHLRLQQASSEKKSEIDGHQKDLDHLEQWFVEHQQDLESEVFRWINEHPQLTFSPENRQELSRCLQGLYDRNRFDDVRNHLYDGIHKYEAELQTQLAMEKEKERKKKEEIEQSEEELQRLRTQKMIEPDRSIGTVEHRRNLRENGQAFVPFYAAVEFREHVTEEQKERIESALKQTGVLDSLITGSPIHPQYDAVIQPEPKILGYTLADYLMPDLDEDSLISNEQVDEVLRSLSLEKDGSGFHLDVDGSYSIGCLVGHAPSEGSSKFIGRSSRKRHQREQIQLWTEKLNQQQEDLQVIQEQLRKLETDLKQVEDWKQDLPKDDLLQDIDHQIRVKKGVIHAEKEALQRIDDQWKLVDEKLSRVKRDLRDRGSFLNIPLKKDEISKARESAQNYVDILHELNRLTLKLSNTTKDLVRIKERQQELEEDLDQLKGETNSYESKQSRILAEIRSIEGQLELKGIEDVRRRIQEVQSGLREAENRLQMIRNTLPQKRVDYAGCLEKLDGAERETLFWSTMRQEWTKSLEKERQHDIVDISHLSPFEVLDIYSSFLDKNDRSKLLESLTKTFLNEQTYLTEYRMFDFTEDLETPEWFHEDFGDYYEPFKNEWQSLKSRRLIQMDYRGQRVSPYYVAAALEKELADQKGYLDEQDRRLYEDIIVNTVGVILRNRIQRAQKWVKKMDQIMGERDNSSGLIFSIAWKPLTAESEQEMDTNVLVKLLQRNSKFLSEEDLERITKHFQSRITKAKELIQLRNEGTTLHQVLKEVLDYRKWFTFVLSFSRVNEPKRELTNNAFFKFSGGEKAMAMYIPLFTAAFSRYKEASADAPYIISLDEAFAGVDDNNIRDMFEVVEQLGFNFIMNSQALWGDYDTISSLSIAELVRNKNADFVTVIHYEWDGKQRSLVIDRLEDQEELVTHEL